MERLGVLGVLVVCIFPSDLFLKTDRRTAKVAARNRISYNAPVRTVFGFIVHAEECDGKAWQDPDAGADGADRGGQPAGAAVGSGKAPDPGGPRGPRGSVGAVGPFDAGGGSPAVSRAHQSPPSGGRGRDPAAQQPSSPTAVAGRRP